MATQKTSKRPLQVGTPAKTNPEVDADTVDEEELDDKPVSLLDRLKSALSADASNEEVSFIVPNRPAVSLTFSPNVDFDTYQSWLKKAEDRKTKEINYMKLANIVISNLNNGIVMDGELTSYVITSPEIHEMLNVPRGSTAAAIKKLYGTEGHAIQTTKLVIEKAGYSIDGDVLEADDDPLDL